MILVCVLNSLFSGESYAILEYTIAKFSVYIYFKMLSQGVFSNKDSQ